MARTLAIKRERSFTSWNIVTGLVVSSKSELYIIQSNNAWMKPSSKYLSGEVLILWCGMKKSVASVTKVFMVICLFVIQHKIWHECKLLSELNYSVPQIYHEIQSPTVYPKTYHLRKFSSAIFRDCFLACSIKPFKNYLKLKTNKIKKVRVKIV